MKSDYQIILLISIWWKGFKGINSFDDLILLILLTAWAIDRFCKCISSFFTMWVYEIQFFNFFGEIICHSGVGLTLVKTVEEQMVKCLNVTIVQQWDAQCVLVIPLNQLAKYAIRQLQKQEFSCYFLYLLTMCGCLIPQILIFLASSNAELSLTPRYAEVAVILLCPSKIPIYWKIPQIMIYSGFS